MSRRSTEAQAKFSADAQFQPNNARKILRQA